MSGLLEAATWVVYVLAAIVMLGAITVAVLAGLGLRLVAKIVREMIGEGQEEGRRREDRRRGINRGGVL